MRRRIYEIVERGQRGDKVSRAYDIFIVLVACISIVPVMFKETNYWLTLIDVVTVYILMFDYILRWMTQDFRTGKKGWKTFARYPFTPMAIVDLLAILPSLGVIPEAFKFLRVLRIFKMFRYSKNLAMVTNVFVNEKKTLLTVLFFALGYIFISALVMFAYEPDTFANFFDALYWSTTALTTIGYGDMYPVTVVGKAISMISSIFGIAVIALPAGIITGSFVEEIRKRQADTEGYYEKHLGAPFEGTSFHHHPSLMAYFKAHPKVVYYAKIMTLGVFLNFVLYLISHTFSLPVWLDTTGTALAAFLLEPAAGLIVAYINNLVLAIVTNDAGNLLYYALSAIIALVYGVLFARGKKITARRVLLAIFLVVFVCAGLSTGLAYLLSEGIPDVQSEYLVWEDLLSLGWPGPVALFVVLVVEQAMDSAAVFVIVFAITRVLKRRDFEQDASGDTTDYIADDKAESSATSYVLGVDVGGTNTKIGVFTAEGELLVKHSFPTLSIRTDGSHVHLQDEYKKTLQEASIYEEEVRAIGLAVPGMLAEEDSNHLLPNVDLDLRIYKHFFASVFENARLTIINDANAAILGDAWKGRAAKSNSSDVIFVALGTGLGAGIISNGELVVGAHGAAGEIGHVCVEPEKGRPCNCGREGCLEKYASATGLIQTARELYTEQVSQNPDESLPAAEKYPNGKTIFDASMAGDVIAEEAVSQFASYLALGLSQMACMFDPEMFIIGGGLAGSSEAFIDQVRICYRECALSTCADTPIVISELGNDCGIYGAAFQAFNMTDK